MVPPLSLFNWGQSMDLYYDARDVAYAKSRRSRHIAWLQELGARPIQPARSNANGFLFSGARLIQDYERLVSDHPNLRDRPQERAPLLRLNNVLDRLAACVGDLPTPKTWMLALDDPQPPDLLFPLFIRTASTSWKLGGQISRVRNWHELCEEANALRRATQWDALILAREWFDLAPAGRSVYGMVPQEIRVWIVDGAPTAWSFHRLDVVREPSGFPPLESDLRQVAQLASTVGCAFQSRLIVADFARTTRGAWIFIEAGPGSCAGTGHEAVYKGVVMRLIGRESPIQSDDTGGALPSFLTSVWTDSVQSKAAGCD